MTGTKKLVDAALYGTGDRRRFTLDSAVLSDVWAEFFAEPGSRRSLLLEPWLDTPAYKVAEALLETGAFDRAAARISYNRTVVVADLTLRELVAAVIPLSGWYREAARHPARPDDPEQARNAAAPPMPGVHEMWEDLSTLDRLDNGSAEGTYPFPQLLGLIRIVGLASAIARNPRRRVTVTKLLDTTLETSEPECQDARRKLAQIALEGWKRVELRLPVPGPKLVYSVTRNRPARLAIAHSVRTVKGDAAALLFDIKCGALTWAVIDSGIDRNHPAFGTGGSSDDPGPSRVLETYDFAYLRDMLRGDWGKLPAHLAKAISDEATPMADSAERALKTELVQRIKQSRQVDWDMLRPFLRVAHDANYRRPVDTHGTHVAGILGAHWDREGDGVMKGMCPDINLIDIRVCRDDGTSDEFVIMSALQFVRYLNANCDRMRVHGVNMSLSLEHDAAVYACGQTPVCEEAERTVSTGVVVVAAAGNHGYRRILSESSQPFDQYCPVSITDPGNAETVITVGSTHRLEPHTYGVSYFSSRGPTGDGRVKPDLVAPGEKIYAPSLGDEAKRLDGTSMAAPHVSGACAMLMARHVELIGDPARIKTILCATATDLGREPYFQGRGLVDVLRAIQSV